MGISCGKIKKPKPEQSEPKKEKDKILFETQTITKPSFCPESKI